VRNCLGLFYLRVSDGGVAVVTDRENIGVASMDLI
jgi:hypothetical protein